MGTQRGYEVVCTLLMLVNDERCRYMCRMRRSGTDATATYQQTVWYPARMGEGGDSDTNCDRGGAVRAAAPTGRGCRVCMHPHERGCCPYLADPPSRGEAEPALDAQRALAPPSELSLASVLPTDRGPPPLKWNIYSGHMYGLCEERLCRVHGLSPA